MKQPSLAAILKFDEEKHPRDKEGQFAFVGGDAGKKPLTERQRKAVSRLLREPDGHMPMERVLAKQLERRKVVRITDHVYERQEWGEVKARLPIVQLVMSREAAQKLVARHGKDD